MKRRAPVFDRAKQEFERVTAEHQLEVLQDNGVWRHLRFARPGTSCGWYSLVTWPGVLCINGDYGSFVFTRLRDMFEFFRNPNGHINEYWRDGDRSRRRECFRELRERVLRYDQDSHDAMEAVYTFEFDGFTLDCFYEHRLEEYNFRFIWCLHAIVRGIQMYDARSVSPAKIEASG